MNEDDIGKYFSNADGSVWQMETYCEYPTAQFRKIGSEEKRTLTVGSLNASVFKKIDENMQNTIKTVDTQYQGQVGCKVETQTCADCNCGKALR